MTMLRIAVVLAAVQQLVVPRFVNPFMGDGQARASATASQIEPAGFAFAIWGPIYLLALAYAAYQLSARGRADPATAKIAPFAIVAYLGSSAWLTSAAEYVPLAWTMPILVVIAAVTVSALLIAAHESTAHGWRRLLVVTSFGLYAGWTVCATGVNIAEVAPQYGFDRLGLSTAQWGALTLAAATLIALAVLTRSRAASFAAAVIWALVTIIAAARESEAEPLVVWTAGVCATALAAATLLLRLQPRSTLMRA